MEVFFASGDPGLPQEMIAERIRRYSGTGFELKIIWLVLYLVFQTASFLFSPQFIPQAAIRAGFIFPEEMFALTKIVILYYRLILKGLFIGLATYFVAPVALQFQSLPPREDYIAVFQSLYTVVWSISTPGFFRPQGAVIADVEPPSLQITGVHSLRGVELILIEKMFTHIG